MNAPVVPWLLAGALAASLSLHVAAAIESKSAPARPDGGCRVAAERLGLLADSARREALERLLEECEANACADDARAAELSTALFALLRDGEAQEQSIRDKSRELAALRAAQVERCTESALQLRKLLHADELGRLFDACCGADCSACSAVGGSCAPR